MIVTEKQKQALLSYVKDFQEDYREFDEKRASSIKELKSLIEDFIYKKMNKHLRNYFNSYKFTNKFWYSLFVDVSLILITFLLLFSVGNYFEYKTLQLTGGKSVEQMQQELVKTY